MSVLLVGLGGVAGVLARYGLSVWIPGLWTIVGVNLAGSFALGVLTHAGTGLSPDVRNALAIGFLGGFTTFSTFTVQTVLEADGGRPGRAAAYLGLSVLGGLAAAVAGYAVGRAVA